MSERHVLGGNENVRGNSMILFSMNLSLLRLISSQFLNLVDQTDCRKSFYGVFLQYRELPTLDRHVLGVFEKFRGIPMNRFSMNVSLLRLIPSQFSNLVDRIDCR